MPCDVNVLPNTKQARAKDVIEARAKYVRPQCLRFWRLFKCVGLAARLEARAQSTTKNGGGGKAPDCGLETREHCLGVCVWG